ncbi:polyadenylate-binding 2 [Brachionus plicatilis]|uniref:Polyadenylate-binding 2 n=1 Tax=Brachionus plicatilis TaxID=10195 RepID=A0A3M7T474_BRAPC|nr:polyadenylate-binding 2 [Brachionus plicatilis]
MKSKNDSSSSDSRESISNGLSKNEDSMSEFDDRSRSRSRSPSHSVSNSSKIKDHDAMSIYIGNVDYSATEDDLKNAFISCGNILRVTIIKNMKTGHPKGAAFIEFMHREGVQAAMKMNGTQYFGNVLSTTKVDKIIGKFSYNDKISKKKILLIKENRNLDLENILSNRYKVTFFCNKK